MGLIAMINFGREKIAKAARELADHLQVIENIKTLQTVQKELADAIKNLNDRIMEVELEIRALRSETALQAVKETQMIVNAVQSGLNQRIETLAVKVALIEENRRDERYFDMPGQKKKTPNMIELDKSSE